MSFFFKPAKSEPIIASFEDGTTSDSWHAWGANTLISAEDASAQTYSAKDGTYTARIDGARGASLKGSANITENLPNYPTMGAHFEYYARFTGAVDSNITCYWCFPDDTQAHEDSWEYRLQGGTGDTSLEANSSATVGDTDYDSTLVSYAQDQWYRIEIYYGHPDTTNSVDVFLYDGTGTQIAHDIANPTDSDSSGTWNSADPYFYDNPSIAFLGGSGVQAVVDYARLLA